MGELFLKRHLFPGKPNDAADQLQKIFSLLGTPNRELFDDPSQSYFTASDNAKRYVEMCINRRPLAPKIDLVTFDGAAPEAKELFVKLLAFDPNTRCSADEALEHMWFNPLREFIKEEVASHEGVDSFTPTDSGGPSLNLAQMVAAIEKQVPLYSTSLRDLWQAQNETLEEGRGKK